MNLQEAQKLVEEKILSKYKDCGLLTENSLEYDKCFVFFYQTLRYIETKDFMDSHIGDGPVLVDKFTGKIFETGSAYSVEQYVASYDLTGDPYGHIQTCDELGLGCTIEIIAYNVNHNPLEAIRCLKNITGKGSSEIKPMIDSVLRDEVIMLKLPSSECAKQAEIGLNASGFKTKIIWKC